MAGESVYKYYEPAVSPESVDSEDGYWFVFCSTRLLIRPNECTVPCLRSLAELGISPVRTQYLGTLQGKTCYSAEVSPDTVDPEGMSFTELRSLYSVLNEDIFLLAGRAVQIVKWDQTHQYCGRCGHQTETLQGERAKKCPSCGFVSYPRLSPAVITAVFRENKILLSHNAAFVGDMHSLIAGFVEPGETLEECAAREILEEVGIRVNNLKYFSSQPWPFPNSLMIGFTADYESGEIAVDGNEITDAGWYSVDSLPELPSKMSIARKMIDWFIQSNPGGV
ncbi:MAG: NAD(+) diphosphatase [Dehalococcoidales bacterium]|jgi:NAD+ diphosphatase|nr:NAD(+) diphosphatase [Dehalococcoidales bacterium]MDP6632132.1 NAD(+) diphosphatase [Dehalococcoidales bacterium]